MRVFFVLTILLAVIVGWTAGGPPKAPPASAAAQSSVELDRPRTIGGTVDIARGQQGHFFADGSVNGTALTFVVDTGASRVALSRRDAERVGVHVSDADFDGEARTANATVKVAYVRLARMRVGEIQLLDVPAAVLDVEEAMPLLGQTFLARIDKVSIERDRMTLTKLGA